MLPIVLRGIRTRNLRGFDLTLQPQSWTTVVGVSGSGKSSLCFHTLHAESQRRFLAAMAPAARLLLDDLPRPELDSVSGLVPTLALAQGDMRPAARLRVLDVSGLDVLLRGLFLARSRVVSPATGLEMRAWSAPEAAARVLELCRDGRIHVLFPAGERPLAYWMAQGFARARVSGELVELTDSVTDAGAASGAEILVDRLPGQDKYASRLAEAVALAFARGQGRCLVESELAGQVLRMDFHDHPYCASLDRHAPSLSLGLFSPHSPQGACPECQGTGGEAARCPTCRGSGLREETGWCRLGNRTFPELLELAVADLQAWLQASELVADANAGVAETARELQSRLACLERLGLGYLDAGRRADSVSLGELHRLKLAALTGMPLSGVCYVLDEPSTGLHPSDAQLLDRHLEGLVAAGNTLLVVEHRVRDLRCDRVLEIGPGPGDEGGQLLCDVPPAELAIQDTPTGRFLRDRARPQRAKATGWIELSGATGRNLKGDLLRIPTGSITGICGPSGAGKSTLILDTLVPALKGSLEALPHGAVVAGATFDAVEVLDAGDEGVLSPRSMVATLAGLLDPLRTLFAALPEAKARGFHAARFSPNLKGGRCEACQGLGRVKVELPYLPASWNECPTCRGMRFSSETEEVRWRGRSLGQILSMSCRQASELFAAHPRLRRVLEPMAEVGLGHLSLGFASQDLSGGEVARVRLCAQLASGSAARLLVLDEPTRGLHPSDTMGLLLLLRRLREMGHTLLCVSHDPVLLARCEWLCELGPGRGEGGGHIVFQGFPEDLATGATLTSTCLRAEFGEA